LNWPREPVECCRAGGCILDRGMVRSKSLV
jgi:hypothetical protein